MNPRKTNSTGEDWDTLLKKVRHPRRACCKEGDSHFKGKFTYCDDRGDIDFSRNLISQMNTLVGDTAVIFGALTSDGKQVETGKREIISGGAEPITSQTTDSVWVWTPVHWENGDWAVINKCLSAPTPVNSIVYRTSGPNFSVDNDLHAYTTAMDYTRSVYSLSTVKPRSPYRGKFKYCAVCAKLGEAIKIIQNSAQPNNDNSAIAFARSEDEPEHIAIGVYRDRNWIWMYDCANWKDGDYAEVEYINLGLNPNTLSITKGVVTFRRNTEDSKRIVDINKNPSMTNIFDMISKMNKTVRDICIHDVVGTQITLRSAEEMVAKRAIMEYKNRIRDFMLQIETLEKTKFPYGSIVKRIRPHPTWINHPCGRIGKVIGWDFENKYYRVFFDGSLPFVGCKEDILESWNGEVSESVKQYTPTVDIIHVNLRGQDTGPIENKEEL